MAKKVQEYITYLSPEFIYVPFDNMETLRIKKSKTVYHNMSLGTRNDNSYIYSPVSGRIIGIKEMDFKSNRYN